MGNPYGQSYDGCRLQLNRRHEECGAAAACVALVLTPPWASGSCDDGRGRLHDHTERMLLVSPIGPLGVK